MSLKTSEAGDQLALMRFLADVAVLKDSPVAQRQFLVDGLKSFFETKIGLLVVADNWRPGRKVTLLHTVLTSDATPQWKKYIADLTVNHPLDADVFADHSTRSNHAHQLWFASELLATEAAKKKYAATMKMLGLLRVGDCAFGGYRSGHNNDRFIGLSLHRDEKSPRYKQREKDLMHFIIRELQELELRGHIEFRQPLDADLPPRLQQILDRTLSGKTPKEIAMELDLSVHTIREHIRRLYEHYKVGNHRDLAAKFMR